MFNIEIKKDIEQAKEELNNEIDKPNDQAIFAREFLYNNSFQGVNCVETINLIDLFIAHLSYLCDKNKISFQEIRDTVYKNSEFFITLNASEFSSLFNLITYVSTKFEQEELDEIFNNQEKKIVINFKSILDVTEKYAAIMTLIDINKNTNCDILSLIKLAHDNLEELDLTFCLVHDTMKVREIIQKYRNDLLTYSDILNIKQLDSSKNITNKVKNIFDINKFDEEMKKLQDYCIRVVNLEEAKQRELRKQINSYRLVETWMERVEKKLEDGENAISIETSITKLPSESIRLSILKEIYLQNLKLAKTLDQQHKKLLENSANHYKRLLKKYDIFINEDNLVFDMSVDELEKAIKELKKANITNSEIVLEIVKSSNFKIISELCSYTNRGFINIDFLLENRYLFSKDNNRKLELIRKNIKYLQEEKISAFYINKMKDVLLENTEILEDNIQTLKEYSLFQFYKKASSYNFLSSKNLADKIDAMLELGYEGNLEENLSLLNYPIDNYKRLELLRRLNIQLDSTEEVKKVLENSSFIIPNEFLEEYILDVTNYVTIDGNDITKSEFIDKLEENKDANSTSRVYSFDNLIVSKNKIKREMAKIENETLNCLDQFNCLSSGKLLSQEDYQAIKNLISVTSKNNPEKTKK